MRSRSRLSPSLDCTPEVLLQHHEWIVGLASGARIRLLVVAETASAKNARTGPAIRFEATVQTIGNQQIMRLPGEASAKLPSRGQVAVTGLLDGHAFETVVEPDGMRGHWVKVDHAVQQAHALRTGDRVKVEIDVATTWPEPDVPDDFQGALDGAPEISEMWTDITPMARWEWVRWIGATKNPETRSHRVKVAISKLRDGRRRPCCFNLSSCTDPELSKNGKLAEAV
ncbi:MAG: DUF1905 domain-containing protein [Cryobacterium sp.]|nr:DUF1905 domain-containing protein [Cryobacterium sp.]